MCMATGLLQSIFIMSAHVQELEGRTLVARSSLDNLRRNLERKLIDATLEVWPPRPTDFDSATLMKFHKAPHSSQPCLVSAPPSHAPFLLSRYSFSSPHSFSIAPAFIPCVMPKPRKTKMVQQLANVEASPKAAPAGAKGETAFPDHVGKLNLALMRGEQLAMERFNKAPLAELSTDDLQNNMQARQMEVVVLMMVLMTVEVECDVVIVGGGPAGLACALYTSRADLKTVVLDKNPSAGALAITSTIANYPGVDATTSGSALLDAMRKQVIQYGTDYQQAQVSAVDVDGDCKTVFTPNATYKGRTLVLASGALGRKASFKGEDTYLGRGVSYCATCDGELYRDKEIAVVGTSREAVDEAHFLTKYAKTLHWITSTDVHEDDADVQDLLAHPTVKHWSKTRLMSIDGDDEAVTGIQLWQHHHDSPEVLPVEGVWIYVAGMLPITDFLYGGVELKEDGGVLVNDDMATSADGVFAIGDIRNTPFKQVVVAAADGCIAAMAIERHLKGRKKIKVDWVHK
eukprot:gnl/MRDRNA2_/MRDRNA2_91093_c0_seq1.p1 gnl/MRDRNA2_/MRDRNA2_91093_c0~~gnl/MRDRNA2_/MRDRNA2_91093_c0_seq1.p1  ORF type:complete len:516 (+),score=94.17 gnl/MRDRNA2_/MRDRNA2_91093_c0_seq1:102-1649(+)